MKSGIIAIFVCLLGCISGIAAFNLLRHSGWTAPSCPQNASSTPAVQPSTAVPAVQPDPLDRSNLASLKAELAEARAQIRSLNQSVHALSTEQANLRQQLANANRDLAEMQFQLDTHSEKFRPLGTRDEE